MAIVVADGEAVESGCARSLLRSPLAPVFAGAMLLVLFAAWQAVSALTDDSPPLPAEWLTEPEQEELAELVSTFRRG